MKTIVDDVAQAFQAVRTEAEHDHRGRFAFTSKLPVFKGHFPGHPIVPGVYLLECAAQAFARGEGGVFRVAQVKQAKFTAPVHPPCEIEVAVRGQQVEGGWKVDCTITQDGTVAMTAWLDMVPATEAA